MDLKRLYEENKDFKLYVDKYCNTYGLSVEQALSHKLVISYAEWLKERM